MGGVLWRLPVRQGATAPGPGARPEPARKPGHGEAAPGSGVAGPARGLWQEALDAAWMVRPAGEETRPL